MQGLIDSQIPELIHSNEILNSTPHSLLERYELRRAMLKYLATLTPREEIVIREIFIYDESLEAVSFKIGRTRQRIQQIKAKALRKLRHPSRYRAFLKYYPNLWPFN